MDEAFGKRRAVERLLPIPAFKAGLTIDEIKTNPVVPLPLPKNAAGEDEQGIVEHKDEGAPAKGPKRYKY